MFDNIVLVLWLFDMSVLIENFNLLVDDFV